MKLKERDKRQISTDKGAEKRRDQVPLQALVESSSEASLFSWFLFSVCYFSALSFLFLLLLFPFFRSCFMSAQEKEGDQPLRSSAASEDDLVQLQLLDSLPQVSSPLFPFLFFLFFTCPFLLLLLPP